MFEHVTPAPADPIFGLTDAFRRDQNPHKINLGAGVYTDEQGVTPVLAVVKEAERRILASEPTKAYLPIGGSEQYARAVRELIFGGDHQLAGDPRVITVQTPGGTGGLRVAGDLVRGLRPSSVVWLSAPTWPNHPQVFGAVGLATKSYSYFDRETNGLRFESMLASLAEAREGDVVVLHGCCHNPTGVDPTAEQWRRIGELLAERRAVPLVDFAYQGFSVGVRDDSEGIRILSELVPELMVCNSFSKNLGLYSERVGALTLVAPSADQAGAVLSQIKSTIRSNYSNPPAHGSSIVTTILSDEDLRQQWEVELSVMRNRIRHMRRLLTRELDDRGVKLAPAGNGFIGRQRGLFSFSGLDREQVERLQREHSIYIVGSGRLNVAGMTESNMSRLCDAIAAVAGGA